MGICPGLKYKNSKQHNHLRDLEDLYLVNKDKCNLARKWQLASC
jgi:hypothetical protein